MTGDSPEDAGDVLHTLWEMWLAPRLQIPALVVPGEVRGQ